MMTAEKEININTIVLGLLLGLPLLMLFSNEWIRYFGILWAIGIAVLITLIFREEQLSKMKSDYICDDCMEEMNK